VRRLAIISGMTTIPENEPPRGGTPLDDAMAGRDAGDEPLVGGEEKVDEANGDDPTTGAEEDQRFA
jgi:hypothetical protein